MSPKPTLLDGAIFLADAHENSTRQGFSQFLTKLESGELSPPQLFLMGDIFDLLVGGVTHTLENNATYIQRLDALAQKFPIYYFEGNHDFNLSSVFLHVKVIPLSSQPLCVSTPAGDVWMLHGDKYGTFTERLYTALIRQPMVLKILNSVNESFNRPITTKLLSHLESKNICRKIPHFQSLIQKRLLSYPKGESVILEGHYHQNETFTWKGYHYVNFSSFACDRSYFVVQCSQSIQFAQLM